MTWRPSALFAAALLAACGGGEATRTPPDDWRALLDRGDGVGAEIVLERALSEGAPRDTLAPYLGEAALLQGDLDEASRWLDGARFAPGVAAHGFHMLGRLRMARSDLAGAGQAFDQALAGAARDPDLWVDIGRLRWRGGEQAEASEAAAKALAFGPKDPGALLFRSQLVRDAQGNPAALPLLERGLQSRPDDPGLLGEYAATLGELGRNSEMLAAVRRLAVVAPRDSRAFWLQAVLAARAGKFDLARTLLQRGGDLDRDMPAAILLLGLIDLESENYSSAAQGFDRLARIQPDNARVAMLLARALALGGNHRELAARFADRAASPYLARLVGQAFEALGERDKAAPFLDRAANAGRMRIVLIPPAKEGEARVGGDVVGGVRALSGARRAREAASKARTFLAQHPGSSDALALAGDATLQAGDAHAALALYRRAAAIRRPWPLTKRMVAALDRTGDRDRATALVAAQLAGEPGNADAAVLLARRNLDRGTTATARALVERARQLGRNDPVLERIAAGR